MNNDFKQFGKKRTGDEEILVMKNEIVFEHGLWQGFLMGGTWVDYYEIISSKKAEWMSRNEAESREDYQQIIPWSVFRWNDYYLELKKGQEGPHTRLYGKYSLGFGGHIYRDEIEKFGNFKEWIYQRFVNEMNYESELTISSLGVVNDNTDELGRSHFGLVYLFEGQSNLISAQKNLEIRLSKLVDFTGDDVRYWDRWSQMVYRQLRDLEIYQDNVKRGEI